MINDTKVETVLKVSEGIRKDDFELVLETVTYVKLWLVRFALVLIKLILIKVVKLCRRAYTVHNEKIIREHNIATVQV